MTKGCLRETASAAMEEGHSGDRRSDASAEEGDDGVEEDGQSESRRRLLK